MAQKPKSKKTKAPALAANTPQDDSEARNHIRRFGDLNREVLRIEAAMNDEIAVLQEKYGAQVAPIKAEAQSLMDGMAIFAEANRQRLTNNHKTKTVKMATGEMSWRLRPAKVSIRGVDDVIAAIKAAKLGKKFLRTKEEINKDAMLADRATASALAGVTIGSDGEDFIVEPFETELQEAV